MFFSKSNINQGSSSLKRQFLQKTNYIIRPNHSQRDWIVKYLKDNFILHEERFYGHIGDVVLLIKQRIIKSINEIKLKFDDSNDDLCNYYHLKSLHFINLGFCFTGKLKENNEKIIAKHIFNFKSKRQLQAAVNDVRKLRSLTDDDDAAAAGAAAGGVVHFEKIIDVIVKEKSNKFLSLWYIFEYKKSLSLYHVNQILHAECMGSGYSIKNESEYVHLLYSCNSLLDASKENFAEFSDLVFCFGCQLLNGISALHKIGVVHRDINPSNIKITSTGVLKITDFGISKKYKWIYYNAQSRTESSLLCYNFESKEATKRIRLGGSFYYMEPHIRSIFTEYRNVQFDDYKMNDIGYHMDYFSTSMIIFEMLFGFTYGDVDLYKKYSFYNKFYKNDLVLFFTNYFLNEQKRHDANFSELKSSVKTFSLKNFKNFIINHENGFIDFLLDGLSSSVNRWSSFVTSNKQNNGQQLNFDKLQSTYQCFQNTDFSNLINRVPDCFYTLLNKHYSGKVIQKSQMATATADQIDLESNSSLSDWICDSGSFYIPELMALENHNHNLSSESLSNNNKKNHSNKLDKKDFFRLISTDKLDKDKSMNRKKYPNIFFNEIIKNIQDLPNSEIRDMELHNFIKSKVTDNDNSNNFNNMPKTSSLGLLLTPEEIEQKKYEVWKYKNQNSILTNRSMSKKVSINHNHKHNDSIYTQKSVKIAAKKKFNRMLKEKIDNLMRTINVKQLDQRNKYLPENTISKFNGMINEDQLCDEYNYLEKLSKQNRNELNKVIYMDNVRHPNFNETISASKTWNKRQFYPKNITGNTKVIHRIGKNENNWYHCKSIMHVPDNNNIRENKQMIPLLDSQVLEILSKKNTDKKEYIDKKTNDIINSLTLSKYRYKRPPKLAFIRPIHFATNSITSESSMPMTNSLVQADDHGTVKKYDDAEVQTDDKNIILLLSCDGSSNMKVEQIEEMKLSNVEEEYFSGIPIEINVKDIAVKNSENKCYTIAQTDEVIEDEVSLYEDKYFVEQSPMDWLQIEAAVDDDSSFKVEQLTQYSCIKYILLNVQNLTERSDEVLCQASQTEINIVESLYNPHKVLYFEKASYQSLTRKSDLNLTYYCYYYLPKVSTISCTEIVDDWWSHVMNVEVDNSVIHTMDNENISSSSQKSDEIKQGVTSDTTRTLSQDYDDN